MTRFKLHRRVLLSALSVSLVAACQPAPSATIQASSTQAPTAEPAQSQFALGLSGSADIGGIPFANAEVKVFQPGQATPIATGRTGADGQFNLTLGQVISAGGGNVISAGGGNVISAGGGNVISAGGGNVISAGGGNVISAGGGNVISAGGGNVISAGGGNVISAGGGNLIGAGAPLKVVATKDGATLAAIGVAGVISAGGGNVISAGGGNVISAGGMNYRTLQAPRRVQMNAATTLAVVALGNRLEGALRASVRKDGVAIDSVVAEVLKAFDQLTGSVGKTLGAGGSDSLVASVTRALDPNGQGQLEATAQQQLNQLAPEFRAAFIAAADGIGQAITTAVQSGGTSPDATAQAPITFAGVEVKAVAPPPPPSGTSTDGTTAPTTSSGGSSGGTTATPTGVTLGGNLNPATPTTATTWNSPFSDLSSFALLGNYASTARYGQASLVIGNNVYLLGGTTSDTTASLNTVMVPISSNAGVSYADTPVERTTTSRLATARFAHTAISLGGTVYVLGGNKGSTGPTNTIDTVLETNLVSGTGDFAASGMFLLQPRSHHAMAMAGTETSGKLYLVGGKGSSSPTATVEVSAVTSGVPGATSFANQSLNTARYGHAAIVTHTAGNVPAYLYVFGGRDLSGSIDTVEVAPLAANGDLAGPFTVDANLQLFDAVKGESRGRHGLTAAVVQGKLFLFGGVRKDGASVWTIDGADSATIDPTTGQITAITPHHAAFVWGRGYYSLALHGTSNLFAFGGTPDMPGSGPNPNVERAFWR
ncbi:MAG: hypothetical protein ACK46X_12500 [Candidatus Sericytochromatia bacterium]